MNYMTRRDCLKYLSVSGFTALVGCGGGGGGGGDEVGNQAPTIVSVTRKFEDGRVYYHVETNDTDGSVVEIITKFNDDGERQFGGSVIDLDEIVNTRYSKNKLLITARDNAGAEIQSYHSFDIDQNPRATIKERLDEYKKQTGYGEKEKRLVDYSSDEKIWIDDSNPPRAIDTDFQLLIEDKKFPGRITYAYLLVAGPTDPLKSKIDDKEDILNENVNVSGFFNMPGEDIKSQLEKFVRDGYETQF